MRKQDLDDKNDLSLDARISERRAREAYVERVDRVGGIKETEINLRSTQMLNDPGESYESLRKVESRANQYHGKGQRLEEMTGNSQDSGRSFRSATT